MANHKLKFVSLFSGCGGFDNGFMKSGFTPKFAYDFDGDAVNNFTANIHRNIAKADLTLGIPNETLVRGVDVVIAGPPCQGFSTAGKRLVNDKRNHLLTLTGNLALRINPKVLVVENVTGALAGEHAVYWKELDGMMREAGFKTQTQIFQAADLGMAQLRRRAILFAWRTDRILDCKIPLKAHGTLRQVLSDLNDLPNHEPRNIRRSSRDWEIAKHIKAGQKLSNVRGGNNAVATWDIPEVFGKTTESERTVLELLRRLRRTDRKREFGDADPVSQKRLEKALGPKFKSLVRSLVDKGYIRRFDGGFDLVGTFNGKFRRLAWDRPSCTVDTRFGSPRYFLHPSQQRGFSVREAARIQGFSDDYVFSGSEQSQYRMIGNAVPPPLGATAARLVKQLLEK